MNGGDFDGVGGLSPETEEVLRRAREGARMPATHKRRLKVAVLARIVFASATLASAPAAVSAMSVATKVVVGLAIVSTLGATSYVALRPARHHEPAAASRPAPAPRAELAEPVVEEPAPPRAMPRPRRALERHVAAPDSTLVQETKLLRDADRALRAGDTATALARLDEHATRFPRGVLAPERAAERFVVMCELGAADQRAVAQFLATHPGSLLAARVRRACAAP